MKHIQVDAEYRNTNNFKDPVDEFGRFFRFTDAGGIKNVGGFRAKSRLGASTKIVDCCFCVLVTNLDEREWPDRLDPFAGSFIYYGDNRRPGRAINGTPVGGNRLLEAVFDKVHRSDRASVPPFLCFQSLTGADGYSYMRFLGLAAPGGPGVSSLDDLVAVWRVVGDQRFQNYRALFSVLATDTVPHAWLEDLVTGKSPIDARGCPQAWSTWVKRGRYDLLKSERSSKPRSRQDQEPHTSEEWEVLRTVFNGLTHREFEHAAAQIVQMMDKRFIEPVVTPSVRDGGRDVVAQYRVGHAHHEISLAAYVEAKLWDPARAVGVRPMMRLISRLKHRDIGVFITTSFFEGQVQAELIEDGHPVVLMSGGDLARLLVENDIRGDALLRWIADLRNEIHAP